MTSISCPDPIYACQVLLEAKSSLFDPDQVEEKNIANQKLIDFL